MKTVKEIAAALFSAPHLTDEVLADLHAYRFEKRNTGAPVDLESAVLHAGRKCQEATDELRRYLTKAAKEAADGLAGLDAVGSLHGRTWFYLEARQSAETMASRMREARDTFNALLDTWQTVAVRIVATHEEMAAKEAERAEQERKRRESALATWLKLTRPDIARACTKHGLSTDGDKSELSGRLIAAGHFS